MAERPRDHLFTTALSFLIGDSANVIKIITLIAQSFVLQITQMFYNKLFIFND